MPLGTLDRTPPPFFKQGPSALSKLVVFSALALFLMVADLRFEVARPVRASIATALYPAQWLVLQPVQAVAGLGGYFTSLHKAQQSEGDALRRLATQADRTLQLEQMALENQRLRALLAMRERTGTQAMGAQVIDYKTWYDCCGFGFRHIISEREFTRSFAIYRKLRVVQDEAHADVMIGHDTGCITTLDKNQWISKAGDRPVDVPVLADCQFAALVCGAHPYKIVQSHWHASSTEKLMEKLGIDWQAKKAEFEAYLKEVAAGKIETLYDPRRMITSGPGFKRISATP